MWGDNLRKASGSGISSWSPSLTFLHLGFGSTYTNNQRNRKRHSLPITSTPALPPPPPPTATSPAEMKIALLKLLPLASLSPTLGQVPYPSHNTGAGNINNPHISTTKFVNKPAGYYTVTANGESELVSELVRTHEYVYIYIKTYLTLLPPHHLQIRCPAGHFCPPNSSPTSPIPCGGNDKFCPLGSSRPTLVEKGHYTIGGTHLTRSNEQICEPGFWCGNGTKTECEEGYYGDSFAETESKCVGPCSIGYYCLPGSTSPTQLPCGDPSQYCLSGAKEVTKVRAGYKSIGGSLTTRTNEEIVEEGYYAMDGVEYKCPAGR